MASIAPGSDRVNPPRSRRYSDIKPVHKTWLWSENPRTGMIPARTLTLVAGEPEAGKSTFCTDLAAKLSVGSLPGIHFGQPVTVVIATTEEDEASTVCPRLVAAGADLDKVISFDMADPTDKLLRLKAEILDNDAKVVILDPLADWVSGDQNSGPVRPQLIAFIQMAKTFDVTILGIRHLRKGGGKEALQQVSGSSDFAAVVRSCLMFVNDEEMGTRVFGQIKNNLGVRLVHRNYEIEDSTVLIDGEPEPTARFVVLDEAAKSVNDVLDERVARREDAKLTTHQQKLIGVLDECKREWKVGSLAEAAGINEKSAGVILKRLAARNLIVATGYGMYASISYRPDQANANTQVLAAGSVGSVVVPASTTTNTTATTTRQGDPQAVVRPDLPSPTKPRRIHTLEDHRRFKTAQPVLTQDPRGQLSSIKDPEIDPLDGLRARREWCESNIAEINTCVLPRTSLTEMQREQMQLKVDLMVQEMADIDEKLIAVV